MHIQPLLRPHNSTNSTVLSTSYREWVYSWYAQVLREYILGEHGLLFMHFNCPFQSNSLNTLQPRHQDCPLLHSSFKSWDDLLSRLMPRVVRMSPFGLAVVSSQSSRGVSCSEWLYLTENNSLFVVYTPNLGASGSDGGLSDLSPNQVRLTWADLLLDQGPTIVGNPQKPEVNSCGSSRDTPSGHILDLAPLQQPSPSPLNLVRHVCPASPCLLEFARPEGSVASLRSASFYSYSEYP